MKILITSLAILSSSILFAQETLKKDSAQSKKIDEVVVTKRVFQKKADRFVYDVASSPVAKGNTVFDLLKQTPLVSSTDDTTLKIAGKNNAIIYINGRKTMMDSESLAQFLKNTPAENIQKLEVITIPGSEFNVESSDGIINIVLKKKSSDGLSGNMRMANAQDKSNSTSASVSLNYRKDKLGISSNISTSQNIQNQRLNLRNGNAENVTESVGLFSDPNLNLGGYLNVDYQLTDKSNLALGWNSWANRSYNSKANFSNTVKSFGKDGNLKSINFSETKNNEDARSYNNSLNLNYELKTDSLGSKLSVNAAYLNYKRFQRTDNKTYRYKNNLLNEDTYLSRNVDQNLPQIINNFSGLVDYNHKFKNELTLSIGGNYNKTKTDNDTKSITEIFDEQGSSTENAKNEPNHFIYDENIYGFYLTAEKKLSDKLSGKVGSRFEITKSIGTSDNATSEDLKRIVQNYNNFLPYLSLNYAINDNHNISYAFSSRMKRPSFWEINPVKNIFTEYNYTQNNPFVKASSTYNQELTYMYKNSYFLVLNHSYIKDRIAQVPLQGKPIVNGVQSDVNQLRYIRTNFGDTQEMSATLGMQKSFFKQYLTTNFNIGLQHNINNGSLSVDPTTGDKFPEFVNRLKSTSILIQTNNTLRLDKAKTWFLGVNYFFVDKQQIELGQLKSLMSLDANIKKIWNNWTFALELTDILNTNRVIIENNQANGDYNYVNQNIYNQSVRFSLTYNFGNQKVKKVRDIDSADKDIKNRTR